MRINKIKKNGLKILLATILCVIAFPAASRANNKDVSFREIFSKSQSESGEAYFFFIPQIADDNNQYTYVYDTKFDRLLFFPKHESLISKIEGQEIEPEDWPRLLNEFILNKDPDARQAQSEDLPQLKVIELNEDWVKFTLDGRHIVLPRKFMVEGANIPLGEEIVNKDTSLPQDYIPNDLVKIDQKWNFHTPEYPKYLRRYVAKPGHSEHQLGTTVDICGLNPKTVLSPNFDSTKEGRWLKENAPKFGFYQFYTKENQHQTGYILEPWHYRFYGEKRIPPCDGLHF